MSKTIYKYRLSVADKQKLYMPIGAEILTTQIQDGEFCLWCLVDEDCEYELRLFYIIGTGRPIPEEAEPFNYIGTFHVNEGSLVFHVLEGGIYER